MWHCQAHFSITQCLVSETLSSPLNPSRTMRIFSSPEYFLRVRRRLLRTAFYADETFFLGMSSSVVDIVPDGESLAYSYPHFCLIGSETKQLTVSIICHSEPPSLSNCHQTRELPSRRYSRASYKQWDTSRMRERGGVFTCCGQGE